MKITLGPLRLIMEILWNADYSPVHQWSYQYYSKTRTQERDDSLHLQPSSNYQNPIYISFLEMVKFVFLPFFFTGRHMLFRTRMVDGDSTLRDTAP